MVSIATYAAALSRMVGEGTFDLTADEAQALIAAAVNDKAYI